MWKNEFWVLGWVHHLRFIYHVYLRDGNFQILFPDNVDNISIPIGIIGFRVASNHHVKVLATSARRRALTNMSIDD
jgi:hypothetical protein